MNYIILLLAYIAPLVKSLLNDVDKPHCQENYVSKTSSLFTYKEYQVQSHFKILREAKEEINIILHGYASFIHSHGPPLVKLFKINQIERSDSNEYFYIATNYNHNLKI